MGWHPDLQSITPDWQKGYELRDFFSCCKNDFGLEPAEASRFYSESQKS
jgi:hypothetical protein